MSDVAELILREFQRYLDEFAAITGRARRHFEAGDWQAAQDDAGRRLALYRQRNRATIGLLREHLGSRLEDRTSWHQHRADYGGLLESLPNWELAETWFNSVTRKVFETVGVDKDVEFVDRDFVRPVSPEEVLPLLTLDADPADLVDSVTELLRAAGFTRDFAAFEEDLSAVVARIEAFIVDGAPERIEAVPEPFFRGQGAYVIARMVMADESIIPLVLAIRNPDGRLQIDAVLLEENDVSILFSFTRAYFHVVADHPSALVAFLETLVPKKRRAELYTSLGFNKHGKTELFRDLLAHVKSTSHTFRESRGAVGLVMVVFDMDDYDIVMKVIRDRFKPPKTTTRGAIMAKYRLVFEHDRAGRLVEAHEFEHLSLRQTRFAPELLAVLDAEAARSVELAGERVVISHAYLERKVTPLNLYVREEPPWRVADAIVDYGRCIKDLMESNIFPGDMLLKNFGVTRHGRVVFYDYDELTRITDCRFRAIPESDDPLDDMAEAPWFSVGEGDVFPEEFPRFMGLKPELMAMFRQHHGDLFDHRTWQAVKLRLEAGEQIEIFPYDTKLRLIR